MNLEPQTPALGVMQTYNSPGFETYRVECSCGNEDDAIVFTVEEDYGEVIVSTYTTQKTAWWSDPFRQNKSYEIENELLYQINYYVRGFLNALTHRLKVTWAVWIHGRVEYSQSTIMTPQQALNYSETLRRAVERTVAQQKQIRQQENNGTLRKTDSN